MIQVLALVAMISFMVSLLTYSPSEGFVSGVSGDAVANMLSDLSPEQSRKAELLNDPSLFEITKDSLNIHMPMSVKREVRAVGKDCRVEMMMSSGKVGGLRLDRDDSDQSRLNVIASTNKGAVPMKWYVITEDNTENTLGALAGHRFNYRSVPNTYIPGYPKNYNHPIMGPVKFKTKEDALYACDAHPYCKGITYDKRTKTHTLRGNSTRVHNGMKVQTYRNYHEHSYVKIT